MRFTKIYGLCKDNNGSGPYACTFPPVVFATYTLGLLQNLFAADKLISIVLFK